MVPCNPVLVCGCRNKVVASYRIDYCQEDKQYCRRKIKLSEPSYLQSHMNVPSYSRLVYSLWALTCLAACSSKDSSTKKKFRSLDIRVNTQGETGNKNKNHKKKELALKSESKKPNSSIVPLDTPISLRDANEAISATQIPNIKDVPRGEKNKLTEHQKTNAARYNQGVFINGNNYSTEVCNGEKVLLKNGKVVAQEKGVPLREEGMTISIDKNGEIVLAGDHMNMVAYTRSKAKKVKSKRALKKRKAANKQRKTTSYSINLDDIHFSVGVRNGQRVLLDHDAEVAQEDENGQIFYEKDLMKVFVDSNDSISISWGNGQINMYDVSFT